VHTPEKPGYGSTWTLLTHDSKQNAVNSVNVMEMDHSGIAVNNVNAWVGRVILSSGSRFFLVLFGRGTGGQFAEEAEQGGCGFLIGEVF